jgi:sulfite exporter TauE/SafE/copper chaperone CopZ
LRSPALERGYPAAMLATYRGSPATRRARERTNKHAGVLMSRRHRRTTTSAQHRSATAAPSPRPPVAVAAPPDRRERDRLALEKIRDEALFDRAVTELVAARRAVARGGGVASASGDVTRRLALAEAALARAASEPAAVSEAPDEIAAQPAPELLRISLPVAGMTCRSCEIRIAKFVRRIPGVEHVTASAVHGRVDVESRTVIRHSVIEDAINAAGYEEGGTPWLVRDRTVWLTAGAGVMLVAALAVVAEATGLAGLASGAGDLSQGGLVVALLLGLAAGVSTCMALVGGLVLALSASYQARRAAAGVTAGGPVTQMRPALVFIAGRIAGYALFGAVLGALGASVAMPPQLTAVMMIAVAIVMILLGTRLTGLSPRIAAWSPTLPMGVGQRLGMGDGATGAYSDARAAGLGVASFFLPCGFTQAVQIYALSTGSPLFAGALLATFAIGTAPGLLALAGLPVVVPSTARPTLLRLVGVVVIGFAIVNGSAGIRLSGVTLPAFGIASAAAAAPPPGPVVDGKQTLHTYQDLNGYRPGNVTIYAGIPTTWTIESINTATCASFIRIPSLGLGGMLRKGANIVELPSMPVGTLSYTCSMGMYSGQITIVAPPTGVTGGN